LFSASLDAVILGAHSNQLFYKLQVQKTEGGSLKEGGGKAWMFSQWDIVPEAIEIIKHAHPIAMDVVLPLKENFRGFLIKIVHGGGAIIRRDLEIDVDASTKLGTLERGAVVRALERRRNSNNIIRYRVSWKGLDGWISATLRGGDEQVAAPLREEAIDLEKVS
tara:strand:+ start:188 stop:679 length:492 start_codon:yes stop_codon:yes gene_type:complete